VLKAGGGYVPLDPIYPPERRAYMVADSGLKVLITDEYLRQNAAAIAAEPKTNCTSTVGPDNLAYVIYTSGSTGKPKGVEIQHRALLNLLWSFRREPGMHESDTLLAVTTISFDIAELEVYLPLLAGASVVIASRDAALNPKELARLLDQHGVTVMQATPATWQMLIESGWTGKRDLKILCGGEALSRELAGRLLALSSELWNVYGPTETTIWSLVERITDASAPILIGRPIANTDVYILDKAGQPVPVGATGELLIGGDGVARGYHNRPDLTAEKFIQHPFSNRPGARLYRTGDLARCRADGRVECLGRVDFQVKIRGFRIELGEIESVLGQRPDVARNVVVVREDTPGDKCIVAYVIPAPGAMFDAAAAQQHLRGALPEYMVPAHLVVLDELPLTPNKKVDRRALPPPARTERTERSYTPPRNALEEKLCRIWAELLRADRVGIHDDFFALGGHSLLAVRLFARVLNDYPDRNLTLSALLQAPTPAEFAVLLNSSTTVSPACLVQMKSGSPDRLPLFCVPGAGGNVLSLRDLAMAMPDDLPFYCLQARGLDGISEPFHTVEESAAYYVQEIRSVQPHGPYNISGGCYGGMIAYEMARLLASQGEEVGVVALIDTYNFSFAKTLPKPVFLYCNARFATRRIAHHIAALRHVPAGERGAFLRRRFHALSKHFAVALAIAAGRDRNQMPIDGVPAQLEADEAGRMKDVLNRVLAISMKAAENYTPDKYSGRIILFKATERIEEPYEDDTLGWSKFAAEVELHEIEANHITIADSDHVRPLAQILDAALRTVDERARNRHAYAAAGVASEASLTGSTISTGAQSS
jgi:amino acid adenylation domain-containing protein